MPATELSLRLEAAYQARLAELVRRVLVLVDAHYAGIDPTELSTSFRRFVAAATRTVELGQAQAQALSVAFVEQYVQAETGRAWQAAPAADGIVGTMRDGRTVSSALTGAPGSAWQAIGSGRTVAGALVFGRYVARAAAGNAVADTAWREQTHQASRSRGLLTGWTWVTSGRSSCPACLAQQDGRIRRSSTPLERHSGCDCIAVPKVVGIGDAVSRPTGEDLFAQMAPEAQAAVFKAAGEEKAAAIREGRATLADFATTAGTSRGTVVTEAPLGAT